MSKKNCPPEQLQSIFDIIRNNVIFQVKVIAKSSENKIFLENGLIKVKINEIPKNGRANAALEGLFCETFDLPHGSFKVISGFKASLKKMRLV
ncbi:MAG: DUF167 domain-containing protein [Rickettsiales bacterium]|jgi:uncharacterized protein YggU (UPF0235/DUF167 family)|nr:DUF167 domain-containing protein [Rickettsiales bacterium]